MNSEISHLIAEVRELLVGGDIELAIDRLKAAFHGNSIRLYDEIVLQESRYFRLVRDHRKALLGREDFDTGLNRLTVALLSLVAEGSRVISGAKEKNESLHSHPLDPPLTELAHQRIIGINNLKQISWIEVGLRSARSVCRILTPNGFGTGFLIGEGLLMTNHHVITSAEIAGKSQAEFNYQQDASGGFLAATRYELKADGFHTNDKLDYSLVRLQQHPDKPPLSTWGCLSVNANADPISSEHVTVIQHPNGGYKQIVLTANWVVATKPPLLQYTTDTMPGSSGSPVFNDTWHVIAIHHAGGSLHRDNHGSVRYVNEGVLMSAIRQDAAAHWPQ